MDHSTNGEGRTRLRGWGLSGRIAQGALVLLAACGSGSGPSSAGGGTGGGNGGGGSGGGLGRPLVITPAFDVVNDHADARTDTVLASIPFPEGMIQDLSNVAVSGRATAWMPMQRWADGTVRIAQAQFTDDFASHETKTYEVVRDVSPMTGAFQPNEWMAQFGDAIQFKARVRDINNHAYESTVTALGGAVLSETPLVRVTRKRVFHQSVGSGGIGRDFLTSTFYVYEFRDVPFLTVDWVVGNDYLGLDDPHGSTDPNLYPLGGIDVNEASLLIQGADEIRPFHPEWHGIDAPVAEGNWVRFGVMHDTYIDDCQTRRYRFQLRVEHAGASNEVKARWRDSFTARAEEPMVALCDVPTWQKSSGLGLHGGPVDGPSDAVARADEDYDRWINGDHFGTWGDFGDVSYTGTSGTPRNTPVAWDAAHAIQSRSRKPFRQLEGLAWMQAIRPYHLFGLQVGAEQLLYLWYSMLMNPNTADITDESLGRRQLWRNDPYTAYRTRVDFRAHGFNGYDAEHWTTDVLFDYWTLTGDLWAKEELRQLGESLKGMMRLRDYPSANMRTTRAEGWCMVGFVQCYLATGDDSLKTYALRRIHEIVEVQRWKNHPSRTFHEYEADPRYGLGAQTTGYPPWEFGGVMFGYLAAHRFFGDELSLHIAEDCVRSIDYSWISNYTNPRTGQHFDDAIRYATPLRDNGVDVPATYRDSDPNYGAIIPSEPLGSVNEFLVGGLALMAEHTTDQYILDRAARQLQKLYPAPTDYLRWRKWFLVVPQIYPHNLPH